MGSATKAATSRSTSEPLLKGVDLKKSELSVTVFVVGAREAPATWNSPIILDIEENHGFKAMALNKTNTRKLAEMISDDFEEWVGYEITLAKVRVNDPSTGGMTDGLEVEAARKSKRKR